MFLIISKLWLTFRGESCRTNSSTQQEIGMKRKYEGKWTGIEGEIHLKHISECRKRTDRLIQIFFNCAYGFICFLLILLFIKQFVMGG
jgi:hypothetical protein